MYFTRLRGRQAEREKRYDDIFATVVRRVCSERNDEATNTSSNNVAAAGEPIQNKKSQKPKMDSVLIIVEQRARTNSNAENHEKSPDEDKRDPNGEFACSRCEGVAFRRHMQLHEHIAMQHGYEKSYRCPRCSVPARCIRHNNVCRSCKRFVIRMREHECEAARVACLTIALADQEKARCPKCPGTFISLYELRCHMRNDCAGCGTQQKQTGKMKKSSVVNGFITKAEKTINHNTRTRPYRCAICTTRFFSRHAKDQHLMEHFGGTIDDIFEELVKLQQRKNDPLLLNQCPMCDSVMGSRKSFRLHVIHKHLLPHGKQLKKMLGEGRIIKKEHFKQEPHNDGADVFMANEIALVEELVAIKEEKESSPEEDKEVLMEPALEEETDKFIKN